jgi:predicted AlkP superfamily pyrophosphatase or phosphodiesterase
MMRKRAAAELLLGLFLCAGRVTAAEKPSLVVVISVDQMRADYLDRFRPYFGKDGFNRFLEHGAVYPEARYRHAVTYTGPGHAAIGTGLDPHHSGIVGNLWYDADTNREIYCVEDRQVQWIGAPADAKPIPILPASPVLLDGASLGDRMKEKFPQARVVGIALKDRAAVLMAGRKADAALWFEERFGRFVTSTYYPPRPSLLAFDERLPAFFALSEHRTWTLWKRVPQADLERITFDPPQLYDAKGQPEGYKPTFDHVLGDPKAIISSPWGDVLMLDLARFIIDDLRLGAAADHPDLLFIGLSSTDYYGHWFGPDSKEVADGMVRLDQTLEQFFGWLDAKVGRDKTLVFLTADHGVQAIPEVARAKEKQKTGQDNYLSAGRVDFSNSRGGVQTPTMRQLGGDRFTLEFFLAKTFGYELDLDALAATEAAVAYFQEPCFYLNRTVLARRGLAVENVKQTVRDWVRKRPGVLEAFTNTEVIDGLPATAPYALAIERSFRADRSGDIFVVLAPGWMWSYGSERGTTHGQPNDDDTRVPLAVWGPSVLHGSWNGKVSPLSIARTVATLYGFEAGEPDAAILEPVLGRPSGTKKTE